MIAFQSSRDGSEIYVMNSDGSNPINLTNNPASDGSPAWSPDGTMIAFDSYRDGNWEICVMNSDGSNPVNLTNNPASDGSSAWSPDGTKIAFSSDRDENSEIYVMNSDGSNQTNLTDNPAPDYSPTWSPDGIKIAFSTYRSGNPIYVINADGSGQTSLLASPSGGGFNRSPAWSPDGTKIAFAGARVRFTAGRDGDTDIWVMNATGSNTTRLTTYWVESRSGWWYTLFLIIPSLALILLAMVVWRFVRHRHFTRS